MTKLPQQSPAEFIKFSDIIYQQNPQRSSHQSLNELSLPTEYFPSEWSPQQVYAPTESSSPIGLSCNHNPQRKRRTLLFNVSPRFDSPAGHQGFIFLDENTFIDVSYFIHPIYIHDKVHTTLTHFEHHDIMHLIHHDIAYHWYFSFSGKRSIQKMITIKYHESRFDSCI